jgi:hypothetical protein
MLAQSAEPAGSVGPIGASVMCASLKTLEGGVGNQVGEWLAEEVWS